MKRDGPTGTLPCAQMLACGRPEANLICMLSVPAKDAVARRVIDVNHEDGPACRRGRRGCRDVRAERIERGRRGLDAVAQEHVYVLAWSVGLAFPWNWRCHVDASFE